MNYFENENDKKNNNKNLYSIIIPTYNERENIGILIYLIFKHLNEK